MRIGRDELLLGAYGSYIRRRTEFGRRPENPDEYELGGADAAPVPIAQLMIVRDELKLSVPIGYALRPGSFAFDLRPGPGWTLDASIHDWRCYDCLDAYELTGFDQNFALYVTFGVEGWSEP